MIRSTRRAATAGLLGVFGAVFAFSVALATTPEMKSVVVAPRSVGTNLRISNPFLLPGVDPQFPNGGDVSADPKGFDLGDALAGSQVMRFLTALGGVQPYIFTSDNLSGTGLTLEESGRVFGTPVGTLPVAFTARVVDASSTARSGYFRLGRQVLAPGVLRFAQDRLSQAQVGQDYFTNVEVLGAKPADVFFSVAAGSVKFNGTAIGNLETAGLTLFDDGTIAGRPLASGTLLFTAHAATKTAVARSRDGSQIDQPLSLQIAEQESVQSLLATTLAGIRGNFGTGSRSFASFFFLIDTDGLANTDFANTPFTFRVGGTEFFTTLDASGQSRSGKVLVALDALGGGLKVTLLDADWGLLLGENNLVNRGQITTVVGVELGTTFLGTEALQFDVRASSRRFQLTYKLGKQRQLGGLFQMVALSAVDFSDGSAFAVKFLASHVKGRSNVEFGYGTSATVHIGPGFHETVPLRKGRGKFAAPGIRSLIVNPKTKVGVLTTFDLPTAQTGIPLGSSGKAATFLLGLDLNTTSTFFQGDASRVIFPVTFGR
ncbi:MAG TPA: hypothetical protein VGP72_22130 [Planctomycetota bacterium]|jgi:hypothetical protein